MPKLYDLMVRMNDEDVRSEYLKQVEIIIKDDPDVSDRVKVCQQTVRAPEWEPVLTGPCAPGHR